SASEYASQELPDLDVSLRGAVSIARRLQDPLAELVKIDPKSIGVGQYQHDVSQTLLGRALANVVEDCVNAVGVDVNTASVSLLTYVAGLNQSLARNIVEYRNQNGPFKNRLELKKVPRLGEKTFEQAAGFLRIMNGDNPLDASAVHPEAYPVVERIVAASGKDIRTLIGDTAFLRSLPPEEFADEQFGVPTVKDILAELEKPGRDPRPEFKTAVFQDHIVSMEDLQPGMILEGVVTNVTNFGAFVDVGVHQDGLVHISAMSYQYVRDPRDVVKAGDVVKVKVVGVDLPRKRIALTMRLEDRAEDKRRSSAKSPESASKGSRDSREKQPHPKFKPANAIAEAFAEALKKKKK
ncbi:MAG TPA: helix-hairpin-helix domain-containing protein, partial [bacterium]|nr:helix-hairpin-helix domain-containing protein [bacterium]